MFSKIMTPVDLAHLAGLGRALDCAGGLAGHYGIPIVYVGVTGSAPGSVAHNPKEFQEKLAAFAAAQGEVHEVEASAHSVIAHDPVTDMDDALIRAIGETGADLVVMASHVPNVLDHIWPSNGGKLAEHAKCSVMLVRP